MPALIVMGLGMVLHLTSLAVLGRGLEVTFFVYLLAMLLGAWCGYGPGLLVTFLVIVPFPFLFRPGFTFSQINFIGLACFSVM
jgi:hypothetical protein